MTRLFYHITPSKALIQGALNCWLAYVTSQPANFDLRMMIIFAFQYFGLVQAWMVVKSAVSPFSCRSEHETFMEATEESESLILREQLC